MEQEKIDKILNIFKSLDLMQKRRDFIKKYKIPEDLVYPSFNYYIGEYIRENISFEECVDGIYYSEFSYDNFFLKKDVVLDYLKIHLIPIGGLLNEKIEDLFNIANTYFENGASLFIGDDEEDDDQDNINLDLPLQDQDIQILEEEKEIGAKNVTKELSDGDFDPFTDPNYIVDEVINILDLKFKGEKRRDIFYDNIIKYIKNIRNKFQTFNILTRNEADGGLEMDKISVDKILNIVENIKREKENFLLSKQMEQKRISIDKMEFLSKEAPKTMELKDLYDVVSIGVDESNNSDDELNYKSFDGNIKNIEPEIKTNHSDVKLVGPIEELALFSIKDFRNAGADIPSRLMVIEKNIKILESYSIKKKILGIKAWLGSEVCNVYKDMINESVKYGSIKKVINVRKENGLLYLTEDEIEGVFELNNKLRM